MLVDGRTAWLQEEIDKLKSAGLYNHIRTIDSPMDAWVTIDGRRLLNFCANNYLGLANHPRICQAAKQGVEAYGVGPGAVRSIAGTTSLHVELEQKLAELSMPRPALPSRAASRPIWPQFLPWLGRETWSSPMNLTMPASSTAVASAGRR